MAGSGSTRTDILLELSRRQALRAKQLSDSVGITIQGVLNQLKSLERMGHVACEDGQYSLTSTGRQALTESLLALKRRVDEAVSDLNAIDACAAIAGAPVRVGDRVGLMMEDGELVAYPERVAGSTGVAMSLARKGEEVRVGKLSGVVEMAPGRLFLARIPGARSGRIADASRLRSIVESTRRKRLLLGGVGTEGRAAVRRAGLACDLRFAPVEAAFNAAQLGLDSMLMVPDTEMADALAEVEARNAKALRAIEVSVLDAARRRADAA